MTPKEKAEQLYDKFHVWDTMDHSEVKKMTLIAVREMINNAGFIWGNKSVGVSARDEYRKYWQEVKQEIEKL